MCILSYNNKYTFTAGLYFFKLSLCVEFSLFSYNNGMVMSSCRELDNNRSALSAASAFAIATAGANEGTPTKEKYRRMSLASTGIFTKKVLGNSLNFILLRCLSFNVFFCRFSNRSEKWRQRVCDQTSGNQQSPECASALGVQTLSGNAFHSRDVNTASWHIFSLTEERNCFGK